MPALHRHERHVLAPVVRGRGPAQQHVRPSGGDLGQPLLQGGHAAATFSVVTTEMLPVGLLTPLGDGLRVSAGTAGLAVTLPGLVAAASAPLLPPAGPTGARSCAPCCSC
ncbi:hypothetical protein [Streptomyces sp. NPDC013187]|uniref:hypothetical protein n=1 Tax=Streptomyces sp. NPDC013187 TaxID=3364865 RepID=UPI0036AD7A15